MPATDRDRVVVGLGGVQAGADGGLGDQANPGADPAAGGPGHQQGVAPVERGGLGDRDGEGPQRGPPRPGGGPVGGGVLGEVRALLDEPGGEAELLPRGVERPAGELVGTHEVGRAQLPDVEQGERPGVHGLGDPLREVLVEGGAPPHVAGAVDCDGGADVQRALQVAGRGGGGQRPRRGGGRVLAAGHAEVEVVEDQHRDPDVAPGGVEQVGAADAGAPVAHDHHDVEVGAGQLDAGGVGDASPVQAVEGAGDEVLVAEAAAPDVAHDDHVGRVGPAAHQTRR